MGSKLENEVARLAVGDRYRTRPTASPWLKVLGVLAFLVLASPLPPFASLLDLPSPALAVLAAFAAMTALGLLVGAVRRRPRLTLLAFVCAALAYWQLPYFDRSWLETMRWRALVAHGRDAQAIVVSQRFRQPQALFFLFGGGGGHPTHFIDLEVKFSSDDGVGHDVRFEEIWLPRQPMPLQQLDHEARKGELIPIRYLPTDPYLVRTRLYLDLYRPTLFGSAFFTVVAPLGLSLVILLLALRALTTPKLTI